MLLSDGTLFVVITALAVDALIGDPDWLWRRAPHPVVWIGQLIGALDRALNRETWSPMHRKAAGVVTVIVLLLISVVIGGLIEDAFEPGPFGLLVKGLLASVLIAQRSLYQHVARVAAAFGDGGLPAARAAVAMIVGRDPARLDEAGVARAAIESAAENFSDGIVAPVFWLALLGWPGLLAYKAINTADSMIGHRSPRHRDFGWAAARLDDLINLVPARMSGLLIAVVAPLAGGSIATAFTTMVRDAGKHRSPNAGWPESAMAGALGIALAGPRVYAEGAVDDPYLNETGHRAVPDDIRRALRMFTAACGLQFTVYLAVALLF